MNILLNVILNKPRTTILIFLIISLTSIIFITQNLKINTSTDSLISNKLEFKKNQKLLKESFKVLNNNILIRLVGREGDKLILNSQNLIYQLKKNKAISFVYSPNLDENFKNNFFLFLNDNDKEQLIQKLYEYQPFLSQINNHEDKLQGFNKLLELSLRSDSREELDDFTKVFQTFSKSLKLQRNVDWMNLLSSQKNETFILFGINQDYLEKNGFRKVYKFLLDLKSNFDSSIQIDYTGGLIIDFEEVGSVSSGALYSGILSFILVAILLWFAFRNLLLLLSILITIIIGLVVTLGITTIVIGSLNLISVAFAVLFIGLSVDYGIQVCSRINENRNLLSCKDSRNISVISKTLLIASVPSIIGFLSFIPTDYIGLSELGIISAIGLVVGLVVNITFLPCLLCIIFNKREYKFVSSKNSGKLLEFFLNKRKVILILFSLILIYSTFNINKINFDADALNLKDQNLKSVKLAKELIEENPTSDYVISLILDSESIEKFDDSHPIFKSEHVRSYFSYNKIFEKYSSDDLEYLKFLLLKNKNNQILERDNELKVFKSLLLTYSEGDFGEVSNEARHLSEKISLLERKGISSIQIKDLLFANFDDLIDFINNLNSIPENFSNLISENFVKRYISNKNTFRVEIFPNKDLSNPKNLRDFVLTVEKYFPEATGMPVVQFKAGEVVINSFKKALTISLLFLIIFLFFVLKKIKYVLLCLSSLISAFILTIFSLIIFKLNLNFANMIALPLLFSLGISYPIYLIKRFQEFGNLERMFLTNTPLAVLFSGLTTIFSFSTLYLSTHSGTSSMGLLLFICLLNTIITSLIILPILIKVFNIK